MVLRVAIDIKSTTVQCNGQLAGIYYDWTFRYGDSPRKQIPVEEANEELAKSASEFCRSLGVMPRGRYTFFDAGSRKWFSAFNASDTRELTAIAFVRFEEDRTAEELIIAIRDAERQLANRCLVSIFFNGTPIYPVLGKKGGRKKEL